MQHGMSVGLICLVLTAPAFGQEKGSPSPEEAAGKRLAELLAPGIDGDPLQARKQPLPRRPVRAVERPEVPFDVLRVSPPLPKAPPVVLVWPLPPGEGWPLVDLRPEPRLPETVKFAVGPALSWPTPNANAATRLPILAEPAPDRGGLVRPIDGAHLDWLLARPVPQRTNPAPFQTLRVPDPFEYRGVVRIPEVDEAATLPAVPR